MGNHHIDLHISFRGALRFGFQPLARPLLLDHEGCQNRTGRRRTPNAAGASASGGKNSTNTL